MLLFYQKAIKTLLEHCLLCSGFSAYPLLTLYRIFSISFVNVATIELFYPARFNSTLVDGLPSNCAIVISICNSRLICGLMMPLIISVSA